MIAAVLALVLAAQPPPATEPVRGGAGGLRLLVVPRADARPERVEALYAGLRDVGLAPVGLLERRGVDLPVDEDAAPRATVDEVRAAFLHARARYRALEMDAVRDALDEALDLLLRLDAPHAAADLVADVLLLRAEIALVENRADDARRELLLLARLEPDRAALNAGLYPPPLVEAYDAARRFDAEAATGFLSVLPRVAGADDPDVFVDGRPLPRGAREGLRPKIGPHLVTVRADGVRGASRVVEVEAQQPLSFEPFLAPDRADHERAAIVARVRAGDAVDDDLARLCGLSAAGAAVLLVDDAPRLFVPGRGVFPIATSPDADPIVVGRATLAALRAPIVEDPREDPVDPRLLFLGVGVGAAAFAVVGSLGAGAVYQLWPFDVPDPPPQPAWFKCCN